MLGFATFRLNAAIGFTGARSPLRSRAGGFPISVFFIRRNVGKYNVGWEKKNNVLMMMDASAVPPASSAEGTYIILCLIFLDKHFDIHHHQYVKQHTHYLSV